MPDSLAINEQAIFDEALDITDQAARRSYLNRVCGDNAALRKRLDQLLVAQDKLGGFLNKPAGCLMDSNGEAPLTEGPDSVIGQYTLLDQIGSGGFGLVFAAKQREPVQRMVALKLIKPGMDTREVLNRFAGERQALALMDHPNIAQVLDAGATESGRPYFVMELIRGIPITDYCDQHQLNPRQRLELFVTVCQAVQHAHQKGIIHRDIKPSNILVATQDNKPIVKVIDFGIAKAIHHLGADGTAFTVAAQLIGTPLYMSPEQAALTGVDVDTRSDIYSLGVLLYELLTGSTPFDQQLFARAAFDEIRRIIREQEPEKPSTRLGHSHSLAAVAAQRMMEPAQLSKAIRGDLDWITMKALEKDRSRRYETANGLARDVQRFLSDQPVEACPPTLEYRIRKFVRRNRGPVIAASLLFLMLVGGIVGTSWGLMKAESARRSEERERLRAEANEKVAQQERQIAKQKAELASAVTEFLKEDMLALASVDGQYERSAAYLGKDVRVRDLLDRAAKRIEGRFADQPLVEAEIRRTIGVALRQLGEPKPAIPHLEKCVALFLMHLGPNDPLTLNSQNSLAVAYHDDRREAEALKLLEEICQRHAKTDNNQQPSSLRVLANLAMAYSAHGRHGEAMELLTRVREAQVVALGPDHPQTLYTLHYLAETYRDLDKFPEAIALFEKVREVRTKVLGPDHPDTLIGVERLASCLNESGRVAEAVALLEMVREQQVAQLGADHLITMITSFDLALAYRQSSRLAEAIRLLERVCETRSAKLGADYPDTLTAMNQLALTYKQAGRLDDAIRLYEQVRDRRAARLGADHLATLGTMNNLARAYRSANRLADAIQVAEEARQASLARYGLNHRETLHSMTTLAICYRAAGRVTDALPLYQQAYEIRAAKLGPDHLDTTNTLGNLAATYDEVGKTPEAIRCHEQLRDTLLAKHGLPREETLVTLVNLGLEYMKVGRKSDAVQALEQARQGRVALNGPDHENTKQVIRNLGGAYLSAGQFIESETTFRTLLATCQKQDAHGWPTFDAMSLLGGALSTQKRFSEAEPLLLDGYRGIKQRAEQIPDGRRRNLVNQALSRLINHYEAAGQTEEADKWRRDRRPPTSTNNRGE